MRDSFRFRSSRVLAGLGVSLTVLVLLLAWLSWRGTTRLRPSMALSGNRGATGEVSTTRAPIVDLDEKVLLDQVPPSTATESELSNEVVSETEEAAPAPSAPASELPERIILLGRFVGVELPSWPQEGTLAWNVHWLDGRAVTGLEKLDSAGTWFAIVPPGPVSIDGRFKLDDSSLLVVAELDVRPSDGKPSYEIPGMLKSWGMPFASEFVTVDLNGKISIDQIVVDLTPGIRCQRLVGALSDPRSGESMTIDPDGEMTFHLVTPATGLDYTITLQCEGWADKAHSWSAQPGSRVLRLTYP